MTASTQGMSPPPHTGRRDGASFLAARSCASWIGAREFRQNLSLYLRRVRRGETLEVTERGHSDGGHCDELRRCRSLAREVGMRLADPQRLARAIEAAAQQNSLPESAWQPTALAQGHSGL